jgi:hypothetical protein
MQFDEASHDGQTEGPAGSVVGRSEHVIASATMRSYGLCDAQRVT